MKDKNKPLVPKLRFPEFRDAGEWVPSTLGKLFANRQESGFESLPLLSLTDKEGIIPQEESNRKNNASADRSRYLRVVPGDIAYNTMRMWEGRSAFVDREGVISPAYTVCEPVGSANGLFFSYYFKTAQLIEQFRRYSQGLVKDTLNLKYAAFSKIPVLSSSPEEQQKIADCLSSLDALIAAQADKIDALKTHKKGLMQQLFPREGETVPRLRFPEFRDAGAWEEKMLEDIASFSKGKGISKSDIEENGVLPCIRYGELYTTYDETIDEVVSFTNVSPDELILSKFNDVIIPASGETQEDIATASCVRMDGVALGGDLNIIRSNNNGVFLSYYLNGAKQKNIAQMSQGVSVIHLYPSQLKTLTVRLPKTEEQQKIADCLSSLDALIAAQSDKVDALKTHKKGLMQHLFPRQENITQ